MINTDKKQIHTDGLIYADLTYEVRGAAFAVYNNLGFGHKESVYHNALVREFTDRKIPYTREVDLGVSYKGEKIGKYRPTFS